MRTLARASRSLLYLVIAGLFAAASIGLRARGDTSSATEHEITLAVAGRSNATPSMVADGRFVAVAWGATTADGKADVFVATSRNGGLTFGSPVQVNVDPGEARLGGELPPRVAIFKTASYGGPDVAVLWTARGALTSIKIARSPNGGRIFDAPITLQSPTAPGDRGWPALTLDPKGIAHAIWLDHRGMANASTGHHHATPATPGAPRGAAENAAAPRSEPAGAVAAGQRSVPVGAATVGGAPAGGTASSPSSAAAAMSSAPRDPVAMAQRSGLYYASVAIEPAAPAGQAGADREIAKGVCYCCKTSLIAGRDGTLFAAWRHVYPGSVRDIAFSVSRDGGKTFTEPTPISRDGWAIDACPDDGPAMAVDASQAVHIVWPTVVGATGNDPQGALFYTSTRDSGRTFAARTRIPTLGSAKASHPQIVLDHAGRLFVAWDESINGKRVAAVREIKPDASASATAATFGPVVTLTSDAPGSYPVLAATSDSLLAAWTSPAVAGGTSTITVAKVRTGYATASTR
jgi:hypothetical protein